MLVKKINKFNAKYHFPNFLTLLLVLTDHIHIHIYAASQ
jgi:hypothetical protein